MAQCIRVSPPPGLSVLERQQSRLNCRQRQQHQLQQQQEPANDADSIDDHVEIGNGWPDFSTAHYPNYDAGEETSNNTKKRKMENCPSTKAGVDQNAEEQSGSSKRMRGGGSGPPAVPPKTEYIHVRARRGQATDSHSLAERVRRERISERMKYLQELVPGCSKMVGKAGMLDEIINYVQSLQRQVELAAVNPRVDSNIDHFLTREINPAASYSGSCLQQADAHHRGFSCMHHQTQGHHPSYVEPGVAMDTNPPELPLHNPMNAPAVLVAHHDSFLDPYFSGNGSSVWDMGLLNSIEELHGKEAHQPPSHYKMW